MAMVMKEMERREERVRTSTAIRLPRHPLLCLYFDIGKLCLLCERSETSGCWTLAYYWQLPWKAMGAAATLRASTASHGAASVQPPLVMQSLGVTIVTYMALLISRHIMHKKWVEFHLKIKPKKINFE